MLRSRTVGHGSRLTHAKRALIFRADAVADVIGNRLVGVGGRLIGAVGNIVERAHRLGGEGADALRQHSAERIDGGLGPHLPQQLVGRRWRIGKCPECRVIAGLGEGRRNSCVETYAISGVISDPRRSADPIERVALEMRKLSLDCGHPITVAGKAVAMGGGAGKCIGPRTGRAGRGRSDARGRRSGHAAP